LRRLAASSAALALAITAALLPGAAVFAVQDSPDCGPAPDAAALRAAVDQADIVVVGRVKTATNRLGRVAALLEPEAFLKGPVIRADIDFEGLASAAACDLPALAAGQRVLVIIPRSREPFPWPGVNTLYYLEGGLARSANPAGPGGVAEPDFLSTIRSITGQYAVPAESDTEGSLIDWRATIFPVGGALLALFGVGLLLMHVWHRIDPS
jgi:hypothetical protein